MKKSDPKPKDAMQMELRDWVAYPHQVDAKVAEWQARFPDLLEVCKEYLRIYCDSDMRPEDECAELYSRVKAAVAEADTP